MYEIVYFASPGFAEVSRFCLEISGLEWKNTIVDWDQYSEMKNQGELPWGYLPIVRTPHGTVAESNAMLRYTAALAGIEPKDLYVRAQVDELVEVINGWREHFMPTFSIERNESCQVSIGVCGSTVAFYFNFNPKGLSDRGRV